MSKKGCELCSNPARMFCDSDQASLCWECDEKVHAANFLVAKHSRTLLCHVCSSLTPWKAAGPRLGATVSVCHACARRRRDEDDNESHHSHNGVIDADLQYYSTTDSEDDSSGEEEEEEEEEEAEAEADEEGENQVVPWSSASSCTQPQENVSSSSKRTRDDAFASSEDEDGCSSSESDENYCWSSVRFMKMPRGNAGSSLIPPEPSLGTAAIVEKLRTFDQQDSETIIGLCNQQF